MRGFGVAVRAPAAGPSGAALVVGLDVDAAGADGSRLVQATFNADGAPPFRLLRGERLELRVLVDRPLVEVFVQRGRAAYVFTDTTFSADKVAAHFFNAGSATLGLHNVSAYAMGCGWTSTLPEPRA